MRSAWPEQLLGDLRFSVRSLCRAPAFSLTVLFTLILGVSVTAGIYDLTAWIVLRGSPYPHVEQLFVLGWKDGHGQVSDWRPGMFLRLYKEQMTVFSDYAGVEHPTANIVINGQPVPQQVGNVLPGTFEMLGVKTSLGRPFLPEEFKPGKNNEVVITDQFWLRYYNRSPDVLGETLLINKDPCTIVGVVSRRSLLPNDMMADIFRPIVLRNDPANVFDQGMTVVARAKPGVTPEQATAALTTLKLPPLPKWASSYFEGQTTTATNLAEANRKDTTWVMLAAGVFLYVIACLNATNLMLIRLLDRRRELNIRFAVGGSRWQVVQIVVIEGLLLTLTACLVVTLIAHWVFPRVFALLANNTDPIDPEANPYWDGRSFALIFGLGIVACVVATAIPALRILGTDISSGLKDGGASMGESRRTGRIRNAFVVLQTAFAVILLTGTGLMVRSFDQLRQVDLGFDPLGKMKISVNSPDGYTLKPAARLELFERLKTRLSLLPGVRAVSYGQDSLLEGGFYGTAQLKMADGTYQPVAGNFVTADFQKTAGLTMVRGRWLSGIKGVNEIVINETLARTRFPGRDAIGETIQLEVSGNQTLPIVGVVKNVRESARTTAGMRFYCPAWEYPANIQTLILRMDQDPKKEFSALVRRAIYEVDPNMVASWVTSIDQEVLDSMWNENYAYRVLKGLAAVALGLTIVGIFSVIAYTVDSRMTEFGVRLALGSTPRALNRLVMRRGITAALVGIVIGMASAAALTRYMQSMLFETASFDPIVYVGVALVLLLAAFIACWIPARRAARTDVMRLLKSD